MKKKTLILTLSVASIIGCASMAFGYGANFTKSPIVKAEESGVYTLSVNKTTMKTYTPSYLGKYVETSNHNKIGISSPDDEAGEDGMYALYYGGGGDVLNAKPIQAIKEISITFKFPTATVQTHGGSFNLYAGDYQIPYYSPEEGQHQETFALVNDNDAVQTQTVSIAEPSKCNYIAWWYSVPAIFEEGYTIIYDITVTYQCF